MKTSELIGVQLDWAVAKCEEEWNTKGFVYFNFQSGEPRIVLAGGIIFYPSREWEHGGPIIEREGISIGQNFNGPEGSFATANGWYAYRFVHGGVINPPRYLGSTPLVAACRCLVASKLGDEIEIPEELA